MDTQTLRRTYRSAIVCDRMSAAVADLGTIQPLTYRTMVPNPRLDFLSAGSSLNMSRPGRHAQAEADSSDFRSIGLTVAGAVPKPPVPHGS